MDLNYPIINQWKGIGKIMLMMNVRDGKKAIQHNSLTFIHEVLLYRVDEDVLGDMRGRGKAGTKELSKSLKSLPLVGGNADRNSTQQANEAGLEYRCGELYEYSFTIIPATFLHMQIREDWSCIY